MDLKVRANTRKFIEENRQKLHETEFGNDLLNMTPKAQATKAKTGKLNCIEIKNFSASEDTSDRGA